MALWVSEAKILRGQLDPEVEAALDRHEADGTTDDAEYLAAQQVYYDLHVCRVVPNPPEVLRTTELLDEDPTVYNVMNGPNEFFCIGTLRKLERRRRCPQNHSADVARLGPIRRGDARHRAAVFDNIPDVRWEIFENSSHMPSSKNPNATSTSSKVSWRTMTSEVVVKK